jgi:hypothetical protein
MGSRGSPAKRDANEPAPDKVKQLLREKLAEALGPMCRQTQPFFPGKKFVVTIEFRERDGYPAWGGKITSIDLDPA